MNNAELIDRLCGVVNQLSDIVKEQGLYIGQMEAVDDAVKKKFAAKRNSAYTELDLLEIELRPFVESYCGKETDDNGD